MADPTRDVLKSYGVLPGQPPVEQMGGVPSLELTLSSPDTTLDADYAEAKAEAAAQAARQEEQAAALAAQPTPQSTLFPEPAKPSAAAAGMAAGGRAAGEGVRNVVDSLRALVGVGPSTGTASVLNLPQAETGKALPSTPEALKQLLFNGVAQLGMSPLIAGFGAAGQGLENLAPEVANAVVADGFAAAGVRGLMSGTAFKALSPEEQQAALAPLTVRELLEAAGPMLAPMAKGVVKKVGLAAEIQRPNLASQRGSIGPPPEGAAFRGRAPSGGAAPPPAEPPIPAGHVRLYRSEGAPQADNAWRDPRMMEFRGRWFSTDRALAEDVAAGIHARPGTLRYVDVPKAVADAAIPTKEQAQFVYGGAGEAATRLLPPEWASKAADVPLTEPTASGGGAGQPPPPRSGPTSSGATGEGGSGIGGQTFTAGESRLNTARITATEEVKAVADRVNALMAEKLAASRKTQTHAETQAAAEGLRLSVEQALALDPLTVPLAQAKAYQHALRDLNVAASTHLAEIGKRAAAGEAGLDAAGWAAFDLAGELSQKQEMIGTEGGRIIEARKIMADFDPAEFQRLREQMAGAQRGDFATVARRLEALPGGTKGVRARSFIRQTWEMLKMGKDMAHELWINWLLTNPVTHAANVAGTGGTTLWEIPERQVAEIVHQLFGGGPEGVQMGETAAILRSGVGALRDGFRLMGKASQHAAELSSIEREMLGRSRVEFPRQISAANVAERMGWNPDTAWGRAMDALGTATSLPTTGLGIEDAFWKGVNYRMELSALALREGKARGLTGEALAAAVKDLEVNPTAPMMADAVQASMVRTLNNQLGPAGQLFMQFADKVPGGRVVAPFIRTPVNSFKWFGQRAPILAQLSAKNWQDMAAGGAAREMAVARQALGAAFTAVIAYEVSQGNITGGGPTDKGLRKLQRDPHASTKPPYSFKVGNDYYNLSRLDPQFGTFVGAIADYMELASQVPTQDAYDEWAAYGEALVIASGHLLINKTWAQGAAALMDAIQDPDKQFGKLRQSYARSVVPAGLRQFTRTQVDDNVVREVRGITDAIKSGLPYYVNQVPVDRNLITGEAIEYPPGWGPDMVTPITVTQKTDSLVFAEIQKNKIKLTGVPRALGGTEVEGPLMTDQRPGPPIPLSAAQRDYWRLAMTQHYKPDGATLYEALDDLVRSARYQEQTTGPGGGRELMFKTIYHAYKQGGFKMLYDASPSLREAFRAQHEARGHALLPVTDPRSPQYQQAPSLGR